jgi:sulfur relay (sulfurtransferase) complex TusBCD TusD component (DsrE family)
MSSSTVILFTRFGLGQAPEELQQKLTGIFLSLLGDFGTLPAKLLFYADGVKLVCEGSPVLDQLRALETKGVGLIICSTCLAYFGLTDKVQVGVISGMPAIIDALSRADKVISV